MTIIVVVIGSSTVITTKAGTTTEAGAGVTHPDATDMIKWAILQLNAC